MRPSGSAKLFRDPVHDTINWKDEGDLGVLISALIDQPAFQRLRFIRQLGLASHVFAGAEHSRFVHSIGVAHLARRILARVEPDASPVVRAQVIAAALLHDIGHGPFSHVFERVFGFQHESISQAIVRAPSSGVHQRLVAFDASLPERVAQMIAGEGPARHAQIVSSQLDADRFDYLLRDVMMTGVVVGRYDLERILVMLRSDEEGLLVDRRAWEAVEGYLVARYHMYRLVYFHRTVRASEVMLERLFMRARDVIRPGDPSVDAEGLFAALLDGSALEPERWVMFSDIDAWAQIRRWMTHPDRILQLLARGLMERRLFKAIDREVETDEDHARERVLLQRIEEGLSPDERYLFAVDEASHSTYQPYVARQHGGGQPVRLIDRSGRVEPIERVSPIVRTLGQTATRLRRWNAHPMIYEKVRTISGLDN